MKNNNENYKLRLAIQKSGRLHDDSMRLLKECGIDISNGVNKLKADATNFPIEVFFLRDDDIPQYVEDGVADIGFVGENVVFEKNKKVEIEEKLGFGKCRLSMAVQRNEVYENAYFLQNKKIATSYPVIVSNFLKTKGIEAEIHEISGSVEIAPGIGLADAICDLVSSGSTLFMNGLKEVEVIFESQAVLIKNNLLNEVQQQLLQRLIFRIQSVKKAKNNKYILLNGSSGKLLFSARIIPYRGS
ncbi:MAG TPA: ATP phosphoribosyltransferase, partial [Sediminibacterium sp.]|uniref:ATP phosphoribosyltransferase n=1 Tax=Sediminibacterium sp. TaxID=1917865 RepID=UPI002C27D5C5